MGPEYRSFHIDPEALELAVDGRTRDLDAMIDQRAAAQRPKDGMGP